jgi:hypothetical protein
MITQQLLKHSAGLAERFGAGKVLLYVGGGCLFMVGATGFVCCGLVLLLADWM